jgi:HPt (histidine-containing phosphotransfer) domain-containing protein
MDPLFLDALATRHAGDGDDEAEELIPLFLSETEKLAAELRRAERIGDELKVSRCMHRLRGSAAIYGFKSLSTFAATAETSPKGFRDQRLSDVIDDIMQRITARYADA